MNIGTASLAGAPYLSVYTATKAYLGAWSFALASEMQAEGLDVEVKCVLSGSTQTAQNTRAVGMFNPSAGTFARAAVGVVGGGGVVVTAVAAQAVQKAAVDVLPQWVARWMLGTVLRRMKGKMLSDM